MYDKSSEGSDRVSVEVEAAMRLRELAFPGVPGERVAGAISRAARRAGLSFSRARAIWYQEARALLASEMDQLRAKAAAAVEGNNNEMGRQFMYLTQKVGELENDLAEIQARLARQTPAQASRTLHEGGGNGS